MDGTERPIHCSLLINVWFFMHYEEMVLVGLPSLPKGDGTGKGMKHSVHRLASTT
jgi:hypothetical protein